MDTQEKLEVDKADKKLHRGCSKIPVESRLTICLTHFGSARSLVAHTVIKRNMDANRAR